ncbi:MAG: hypothetical protein ACLGGV_08345 [Bacteroidia bacterium]
MAFLFSCKTEVDLRAPYDDKPIVFGLLDQSVDTQYIKINKSFIGDGNNFDYAGIPDCTIYKNIVGTVKQISVSGQVAKEYNLQEKYVKNIQDGIFYTDSQKVYYFVPDIFDENASYRLDIFIDGDRKKVSAETDVVSSNLNFDNKSFPNEVKFITDDNPLTYAERTLTFIAPKKEMLFSATLRFYYDEHLTSGSVTRRYIEFDLGDLTSKIDKEDINFILNGESFYSQVMNDDYIKSANNNSVDKRVVRHFEYKVSVANQELTTYIKLNQPNSSIAQETPSYTNIDGGLGVFASRFTIVVDQSNFGSNDMLLHKLSLEHLYNLNLKFCSDDPKYSASSSSGGPEDFYCP